MAFTIPNQSDAGTSSQAEVDAVDFGILVAAYNGTGVVTGGAVTAQGTPDMTVAVAAGTVLINGLHYTISAGNGTISTADSSNPRFDLITINTSGAIVVTAGTAASNPVFPAIPADDAVLAAVHVPAGDTAIATAQITDKRVIVKNASAAGTGDDVLMRLGDGGDIAIVHRATVVNANEEIANLTVGTSAHLGAAVNSLVVSNITTDGDMLFLVSDGGNSKGVLKLDGANGAAVVQRLYFYDVGGEYMESDGSTLTITGTVALGSALPVGSGGTGATSLNNLITLGTHTAGAYIATLANATNGGTAVTGSGSEAGAATVALNFNDLTDTAVNVAADSITFLDADGTASRRDTIADFVSAIAGANLTATSGQLAASGGGVPNAFFFA